MAWGNIFFNFKMNISDLCSKLLDVNIMLETLAFAKISITNLIQQQNLLKLY